MLLTTAHVCIIDSNVRLTENRKFELGTRALSIRVDALVHEANQIKLKFPSRGLDVMSNNRSFFVPAKFRSSWSRYLLVT